MALTGPELALVVGVMFAGGLIAGVTGFGYAVFATASLASVIDPRTAVVIVIIPLIAANLSLIRELTHEGLRSCARRFWSFVAGAAIGTVVGMEVLSRVAVTPLTVMLGLFTLASVAISQPWIEGPGNQWLSEFCVGESALK